MLDKRLPIKIGVLGLIGLCSLMMACQTPASTRSDYDLEQVKREVTQAVWAFHAADTAKNAQGVLDLLWPEYTMLADGKRISYADVAAGSPVFMESLRVFHTEWTDLQIIPISDQAALSSFLFRDSLVTNLGEVMKKQGPNTFLWEKRGAEWRVRYGDADHYPWD
ncbi:MAG: nuclear transport factor 2 family protein [Bacteroidota bacterium]